jgi:autotransporter-associated beta strand protein
LVLSNATAGGVIPRFSNVLVNAGSVTYSSSAAANIQVCTNDMNIAGSVTPATVTFQSTAPTTYVIPNQLGSGWGGYGMGGSGTIVVRGSTTSVVVNSLLLIGRDNYTNSGTLIMGDATAGDSPTMTVNDWAAFGNNGSTGTVILNNASQLHFNNWINVGDGTDGSGNVGHAYVTLNGNSVFTVTNSMNIATNAAATVAMHDNSSMTVGGWFGVGRDSTTGTGVFTMDGNSTLTVGSWANIGSQNGAQGTMTMSGHTTATFASDLNVGSYGNGDRGVVQLSGNASLSIAGQYTGAYSGSGGYSELDVGGSSSMTVGGLFYMGVWGDSTCENHITLSDHGSLTVGTGSNREWLQLGDSNSTFTLTMSGASTFTSLENGAGINKGTVTMSDSAQIIVPTGELRIGCQGNPMSLTMSGTSAIHGDAVEIGMWGTPVTAQLSGSAMITGNSFSLGTGGASSGASMVLSNSSSIHVTGGIQVGDQNTVSSLTINDSSSVTSGADFRVGYWGGVAGTDNHVIVNAGSTGTANLHVGGTLYVGTQWGNDPVTEQGNQYVTVSGAGAVVTAATIRIGGEGGTGVYNQNGGLTSSTNQVLVGDWDDMGSRAGGTGTLNLNGGVFNAPSLAVNTDGSIVSPLVTVGIINFNGGTLQASGSSTDFITVAGTGTSYSLTANVLAGGAKIDTQAYAVTINQALVHASGTATDGGLTKTGSGTLTVAGANTYTGLTAVKGGQLVLSGAGAINDVLAHVSGSTSGADVQAGQLVFAYGTGGTDPITTIRTALHESYVMGGSKLTSGPLFTSTGSAAAYGYGLYYGEGTGSLASSVVVKVAMYGDADGNGTINAADLNKVLTNYGKTGQFWTTGDFNYDGVVNAADLNKVLTGYGHTMAGGFDINVSGDNLDSQALSMLAGAGFHVVVPEPGTLALLAAGLFGLLAYAWRKRK